MSGAQSEAAGRAEERAGAAVPGQDSTSNTNAAVGDVRKGSNDNARAPAQGRGAKARMPTLNPLKLNKYTAKGDDAKNDAATSSFTSRRNSDGTDAHAKRPKDGAGEAKQSSAIATSSSPSKRRDADANKYGAVSVKATLGDALWRRLPGSNKDLGTLATAPTSNSRAGNIVDSGMEAVNTLRDKGWRREWRGIHLPPSREPNERRERVKKEEAEVPELPAPKCVAVGKEEAPRPVPAEQHIPMEAGHENLPSPSLSSGPSVPLYPLLAVIIIYHLLKHLLFKRIFTYQKRTQISRSVKRRMKLGLRGMLWFGGDGRQFTVSQEELETQLGKLQRKKEERIRRESGTLDSCDDGDDEGDGNGGGRGGSGGVSGGGNNRGSGGGRGSNDGSGGGRSGDDTTSPGNNPSSSDVHSHSYSAGNDISTFSDQPSFLLWMKRSEDLERAHRRVEQLTSDLVCAKENALILREELAEQSWLKDENPTENGMGKRRWMKMNEELERAEKYVDRLASDLCVAKEKVVMLNEREGGRDEKEGNGEEGSSCDDRLDLKGDEDENDGDTSGSGGGGTATRGMIDGSKESRAINASQNDTASSTGKTSGSKSDDGKENSTRNSSLSNELKEAMQKIEELEATLACAEEQSKQAAVLDSSARQLQSQVELLTTQNQELTNQNATLNESVLKLQEENEGLDREMEHLVVEMEQNQNRNGEGEHKGESLEFDASDGFGSVLSESLTADPADAIVREAGERETLRATVEELRQDLSRAREDVAQLKQERDGAVDDARGLSLELARAKDENTSLKERSFSHDLPAASAISFESQSSHHTIETYDAMRAERNHLRSQVGAAKDSLSEMAAEMSGLKKCLTVLQDANKGLRADLEATRTQKVDLETRLAGTTAKFAAIETEQKDCLQVLDSLAQGTNPKQLVANGTMQSRPQSPTFERVASHADHVRNLQGRLELETQAAKDQSAAIAQLKAQVARRELERDNARLELESERLVMGSLQSEHVELLAKIKARHVAGGSKRQLSPSFASQVAPKTLEVPEQSKPIRTDSGTIVSTSRKDSLAVSMSPKRARASGLRRLLSRNDKKKQSKRSASVPGAAVAIA
ncbi:hypothetical protein ACHAXT_003993 [Thalassiosira profunda]